MESLEKCHYSKNALDLVLYESHVTTALFSHFEFPARALDGDPVDGHGAADLPAASVVALGDVVVVHAGNEALVRTAAVLRAD